MEAVLFGLALAALAVLYAALTTTREEQIRDALERNRVHAGTLMSTDIPSPFASRETAS